MSLPDLDKLLEDDNIVAQKAENIYVQEGVHLEQKRIMKLLDTTRMCKCKPTCRTDINIYAFVLEELGIDLFKLIKDGTFR